MASHLAIDFLVYRSSGLFHRPATVFSPPTYLSTPSPRLKIIALCAMSNTFGRSSSEASPNATYGPWCTSKALILSLHRWKSFSLANFFTSSLDETILRSSIHRTSFDTSLLKLNQLKHRFRLPKIYSLWTLWSQIDLVNASFSMTNKPVAIQTRNSRN